MISKGTYVVFFFVLFFFKNMFPNGGFKLMRLGVTGKVTWLCIFFLFYT